MKSMHLASGSPECVTTAMHVLQSGHTSRSSWRSRGRSFFVWRLLPLDDSRSLRSLSAKEQCWILKRGGGRYKSEVGVEKRSNWPFKASKQVRRMLFAVVMISSTGMDTVLDTALSQRSSRISYCMRRLCASRVVWQVTGRVSIFQPF